MKRSQVLIELSDSSAAWTLSIITPRVIATLPILFCLLNPTHLHASDSAPQRDIVEEVKQRVMNELTQSGWLSQQIEAGIEQYVQKVKNAQEAEVKEQQRQINEKAKKVRHVIVGRDHIRGNPTADISLIEYSDFECPFCKRFHTTALELIKTSDGKVNWIYRHFPLAFHNPGAQQEAEAAECAFELGGDQGFWAYADAIYARTTSNGNGFNKDKLIPLAQEAGLNAKDFEACLESANHAARVKEDLDEGERIGITGTPGNVLYKTSTGEARLITGAVPLSEIQSIILEMLKGTEASDNKGDNRQ